MTDAGEELKGRVGGGPRRRGRRWRSLALIVLLAGVVAGGVALRERVMERAALEEVAAATEEGTVRAASVARVLDSVRSLKLVTVEITSHVNSESADESWRGDVKASVDAPVKLFYGTDLSRLKRDSVRAGPLGESWIVTVPPPERVATEVFGERETTDVSVGWLRSRSMSGEKHLGLARRDLYAAARRLSLGPDDMQRVRAQTRDQVGALIKTVVGPMTWVTVRFEDEVSGDVAGGGERP